MGTTNYRILQGCSECLLEVWGRGGVRIKPLKHILGFVHKLLVAGESLAFCEFEPETAPIASLQNNVCLPVFVMKDFIYVIIKC